MNFMVVVLQLFFLQKQVSLCEGTEKKQLDDKGTWPQPEFGIRLKRTTVDDLPVSVNVQGCFRWVPANRILKTLILTFRDPKSKVFSGTLIDWSRYDIFLNRIVHECYKKAIELGYNYYGIAYYGECWADFQLPEGLTKNNICFNEVFRSCKAEDKICGASKNGIFVYKIVPVCPVGLIERLVCTDSSPLRCGDDNSLVQQCQKKKYICRCPENKPFEEYGKCYKPSECPQVDNDGYSNTRTGHTFVISGKFENSRFAFGMHASAIRLSPHWYHSVVLLQVSEHCRSLVKRAANTTEVPFLVFKYDKEPIRLVDLVLKRGTMGFQTALYNKATLPEQKIAECEVKFVKVLDLRRYNSSETQFPSAQKYLMFGRNDSAVFLSHLPSRCGDFQELIQLEKPPSSLDFTILEKGVEIILPDLHGNPKIGDQGKIGSRLVPGKEYFFKIDGRVSNKRKDIVKVKKTVAFDDFIFNIGC